MSLRVLLIDDEPLARAELRRLLRAHPEIDIVAEAESADAADTQLHVLDQPPDAVFLDIQMPGRDGFAWLTDLSAAGQPVPEVVFVTAYDAYALRAFEASALDYLTKPVEPERLADAVERLHQRIRAADDTDDAGDAPPDDGRRLGADDRVFVKDGDAMHLVRVGDVRLFESIGNYTRLHFTDASGRTRGPMVLRSLSALEDRIRPSLVARANRSEMIGLAHVVSLDDGLAGGLIATLSDGRRVEFSRRQAQSFRERLTL